MNAIKLNVQSTEQEIEINDLVLTLKFDDESLKRYEQEVVTLAKEIEDKPSNWETINKYVVQLGDLIFSDGTGLKIYEACGKSSAVAINVIYQILDIINEKIDDAVKLDNAKIQKYASKAKRK